jgi:hypothetical protein
VSVWWTVFWVALIVVAVAADIIADRNDARRDTLTEHLRWWLGIGEKRGRGLWVRRMLALAFFVWVPPHLFGWL